MSTDSAIKSTPAAFEPDLHWELHHKVQIRPERFGALLYHFDTRRLSFVKSPLLLSVLERLAQSGTARQAMLDAGVTTAQARAIEQALATLATSEMICRGA